MDATYNQSVLESVKSQFRNFIENRKDGVTSFALTKKQFAECVKANRVDKSLLIVETKKEVYNLMAYIKTV